MQKKTYLSVDLDFWNQGKTSLPHMKKFLATTIKNVKRENLLIVDSHEEILSHINSSNCNNLINVDWHSDITNRFEKKYKLRATYKRFNCGSWVTFVDFRKTGKFTWIHPYKAGRFSARGMCHYPFKPEHNPFLNPKLGGWNNIEEIESKKPEQHIEWNTITHVGICYSYDWVRYSCQKEIFKMAHEILGFKPQKNQNAILS